MFLQELVYTYCLGLTPHVFPCPLYSDLVLVTPLKQPLPRSSVVFLPQIQEGLSALILEDSSVALAAVGHPLLANALTFSLSSPPLSLSPSSVFFLAL